MTQLLGIVICFTMISTYAAENTVGHTRTSQKRKDRKRCHASIDYQAAEKTFSGEERISRADLFEKLRDGTGADLLETVRQYPSLRAPRIRYRPVVLGAIYKFLGVVGDIYPCGLHRSLYPKEQIEELLKLGVSIDQQQENTGQTALMEMTQGELEDGWGDKHTRFTQGLLDHKADPTLQDDQGRNALVYAFESDRTQRQILVLLQHEKIPSIINQPTRIRGKQQTYMSALIASHDTAYTNRTKIMKALLKAGAVLTEQNRADVQKQPILNYFFSKKERLKNEEKRPQ